MTSDELLDDLGERIDRGVEQLRRMASATHDFTERGRLDTKASGMLVVRDWLRSYRTPKNVEGPFKPFCASSPEAQLLSDEDFWAAVYPQDHFARDEPDPDDCPDFTTAPCIRCGCGIRVESWEEACERQDESFCDDCADEMADEMADEPEDAR